MLSISVGLPRLKSSFMLGAYSRGRSDFIHQPPTAPVPTIAKLFMPPIVPHRNRQIKIMTPTASPALTTEYTDRRRQRLEPYNNKEHSEWQNTEIFSPPASLEELRRGSEEPIFQCLER